MSTSWFHFGDALAGAVLAHVLLHFDCTHYALTAVLSVYVLSRFYELCKEAT